MGANGPSMKRGEGPRPGQLSDERDTPKAQALPEKRGRGRGGNTEKEKEKERGNGDRTPRTDCINAAIPTLLDLVVHLLLL